MSEAYSGILKIIDFGDGTENIYPTFSRPDMEIVVELLNELNNEIEQLKKENERLKRLTAHYKTIDINELATIIAECKGITVEECLEEMRKEFIKGLSIYD